MITTTRTCIRRKFISTCLPVYLPYLNVLVSRLQRFHCRSISSLPVANSMVADDKHWWFLQLQTACRQQSRVWQTTVRRKRIKQERNISTDATIAKFFWRAKAIVAVFISLPLFKRSLFYLLLLSGDEMLVRWWAAANLCLNLRGCQHSSEPCVNYTLLHRCIALNYCNLLFNVIPFAGALYIKYWALRTARSTQHAVGWLAGCLVMKCRKFLQIKKAQLRDLPLIDCYCRRKV